MIDGWLADLPDFIVSLMDADLSNNLNFLVSGDACRMIVTAEEKAAGAFDVHLFCPRRIKEPDVSGGMAAVKNALFALEAVKKLIFTVRSKQRTLKKCLAANGCVWTGWRYSEKGNVFEHWILEKSL